ncbi:GNAT family N-acetyltransferase [Nisaea acidiphila]|uniref:GNAT family N-acetyltransferase n=1 Tax=Nisaea acidiphila TaxID=1862145 RepID=A0A9J7ARL5_9PROT|nr:GNAT family N-acetyltransferase [Nisaea acidiphila]UUX49846.1 GNAT family N-acetyltransferase [Nisaea acidiphila]
MNVELRAARREDADALTTLFRAARREAMPYLPELHSENETRCWMERVVLASDRVTIAETSGEIVGFSAVRRDHINHLYVAPGAQGKGIGTRLLDSLKAYAGSDLSLYVFLKNSRARAFYERHGFVCVAYGDGSSNEENEPDAIYVLRDTPCE